MKRKFFLAIFLGILLAFSGGLVAEAKVNINTASSEELQTLNGIGPSLAERIINYRETVGAFVQIEDIMNVSGIKEAVFAKIRDFITVSDETEVVVEESAAFSNVSDEDEATEPLSRKLKLKLGPKQFAAVGFPVNFRVESNQKQKLRVHWSFGDGGSGRGLSATHIYYAPGIYNVVASGSIDDELVLARTQVEVFVPKLSLQPSAGNMIIKNASDQEVNLGGWKLIWGKQAIVLPTNTILSGETTLTIPREISGFAADEGQSLALFNPIDRVVAQAGVSLAEQDKVAELQARLTKASLALSQLKAARSKSVPAKLVSMPVVATSSEITREVTNVIELKAKPNWWGKLINQVLP